MFYPVLFSPSFQTHPTSPPPPNFVSLSFFFNKLSIPICAPIYSWVWDHLIECDRPPRDHTPLKNDSSFPPAPPISHSSSVRDGSSWVPTSTPPLMLECWLAWSSSSLVQVTTAEFMTSSVLLHPEDTAPLWIFPALQSSSSMMVPKSWR